MEKNLVKLLSKGMMLQNLYTNHKYKFIKQDNKENEDYLEVVLCAEEKWNKYKMVYEDERSKTITISRAEVIPSDFIPFVNKKGKVKFEVRNMDIVTYKQGKKTIKARVILIAGAEEPQNVIFTFVGSNGEDISDTGKGYTASEFAVEYNKNGRAVRKTIQTDGVFSEVDTRFNVESKNNPYKVECYKKPKKEKKEKKEQPLLSIGSIKTILKGLKFEYKDGLAIEKKKNAIVLTKETIHSILQNEDISVKEKLRYEEAFNLAEQLKMQYTRKNYLIELANAKRAASIDVTKEEKDNTAFNINRLNGQIGELDIKLKSLNEYREMILIKKKAEKEKNRKQGFFQFFFRKKPA